MREFMVGGVFVLGMTALLAATGICQDAPRRADLPASLWFGMKYDVVRQRLDEQGVKLSQMWPMVRTLEGGRFAEVKGLKILGRSVDQGRATFLGDSSLVGLDLPFHIFREETAWTDSVAAALVRKYGPPVDSDFATNLPKYALSSAEQEATWSVGDSEIKLRRTVTWPRDKRKGVLTLDGAHLSHKIPPYRKGVVPQSQEP